MKRQMWNSDFAKRMLSIVTVGAFFVVVTLPRISCGSWGPDVHGMRAWDAKVERGSDKHVASRKTAAANVSAPEKRARTPLAPV